MGNIGVVEYWSYGVMDCWIIGLILIIYKILMDIHPFSTTPVLHCYNTPCHLSTTLLNRKPHGKH